MTCTRFALSRAGGPLAAANGSAQIRALERLVHAEICRSAFTGLAASVLVTGFGCGLKDRGDVVCGVEPPGCDVDYQVVGGIVGQGQAAAVEAVEGDECR